MQIIELVPDLRPTILAARQARDARNTLARFLPNTAVEAVSYRLGRRRRLDQVVPVRALDTPATPIRRPGVLDVRGDLPAITPIVNLTEQDLTNEMVLARQLAGLSVDWQGAVDAAAGQVALTIDNTLEVMRGQVLASGVVSLQTPAGVVLEVDFQVPGGQKIVPSTKWTDGTGAPTGDPFRDLADAHEVYIDASGAPAGAILTTTRVVTHLTNRLQAMYPMQPVGQNELNAYLANRNLPAIITNDRRLENYDGTKTRVYPEGHLTFLPSATDPVGRTELGITQEAVQQVQGRTLQAAEAPGITIVTMGKDNPPQRAVKGAAIGLPVLQDIDSVVILSGVFS